MTFASAKLSPHEEIAAALDWWRDAGVDHDFSDDPKDWLARPDPEPAAAVTAEAPQPFKAPVPAAPPRARIGGDPAHWPQDLAAFSAWWMEDSTLDNGSVQDRVAPFGPAGAELMILVEHPEAGDGERLLSGPHGKLIAGLLRALGVKDGAAYFAAALPRHMPLPDWTTLDDGGLGELARHHVGLVAPKRVIAFGPNVSSLLGHDPANSGAQGSPYYRIGGTVAALAAPGLDSLIARPAGKARLWQWLLDWHEG